MISKDYWTGFYDEHSFNEPSTWAQYCLPLIDDVFVELGCGDGRDLYYFIKNDKHGMGVDASHEGLFIMQQEVEKFIAENMAPPIVYTRFFWHAIDDDVQNDILDWVSGTIMIEARTTKDKPKNLFGRHKRNQVDTKKLKKQLQEKGFNISKFSEGRGLSPYLGEDPHLFRVIATKT